MEAETNKISLFSYGIYSCKWGKRGTYHIPRREILEKLFFVIAIISYVMCTFWLYSWSVLENDSSDFNQFIYDEIKDWFQWYILILVISILGVVYGLVVTFAGLLHGLHEQKLYLSLCHKVLVVFFLTFAMAGFILIGYFWPDKNDQWRTIAVSFDMTSPFLQICALILWVLFAIFIGYLVRRIHTTAVIVLIIGFYGIFLIFLLTLPLWLHSPCIGLNKNEVLKPHLFGHRGSPTQAPENTMFSFEKALNCDVYAFESDVRISVDGIPFLMHDSTLFRTTNVSAMFPKRKNADASSFSWDELSQLNAGEWYLKNDPFLTNKHLSGAERNIIMRQKIPSLKELAGFAAKHNKSIMFDLARPPYNHPNHNDWVNVSINALFESGIPQHNVLWLLGSGQSLEIIKTLAPGFRIVIGHVIDNPKQFGIDAFNLLYSMSTAKVISMNISVISYTIDTSWAFSRALCQGVWAVTTTTCPLLHSIARPSWSLTKHEYLAVWIPIDILSLFVLAIIAYRFSKTAQINYITLESDNEMVISSITE